MRVFNYIRSTLQVAFLDWWGVGGGGGGLSKTDGNEEIAHYIRGYLTHRTMQKQLLYCNNIITSEMKSNN